MGLYATSRFIVNHPMNAGRKVKALTDFLRWQIATRLMRRRVVVRWVEDSRFIAGSGETGLTGNIYAGFMEWPDMPFLLHALRPSDTFIDVGANVGAYTILASGVIGARSVSFEPLPETFERLRDQIQINRIESLADARNMGIGSQKGMLHFTNNADTINRVSDAGEHTTAVTVSTLDDELIGADFVKIDVEGYEAHVIDGASRTLRNCQAVIMELNTSGMTFGYSDQQIHEKLTAFGFTPVSYDPSRRVLTKLETYRAEPGNTIYVRDPDLMGARCKDAPHRVVHTAGGVSV